MYTKPSKEVLAERARKWRAAHPEKREGALAVARAWKAANRDRINAYSANKRKTDPAYKLSEKMRVKLRRIIIGRDYSMCTYFFGCDREMLLEWIESHFEPGMTWENRSYYGWQIDHVIPCHAFDQLNDREFRACWIYKNLRPKWRIDNQGKNKTVPDGYDAKIYAVELLHSWATRHIIISPEECFENLRKPTVQ